MGADKVCFMDLLGKQPKEVYNGGTDEDHRADDQTLKTGIEEFSSASQLR